MEAQSEPAVLLSAETTPFDFESLFHEQYGHIAKVINRILGDPAKAEDLSVEVFWKLLRTPNAHGPGVNGWLYTTAVRKALDELRIQSRRYKYEGLFSRSQITSTEYAESGTERQDRVRATLAALGKRCAEILVLRGEGFSYQEIAEALRLNPSSVGTLLSRAQEEFRKEYINRYGKP